MSLLFLVMSMEEMQFCKLGLIHGVCYHASMIMTRNHLNLRLLYINMWEKHFKHDCFHAILLYIYNSYETQMYVVALPCNNQR